MCEREIIFKKAIQRAKLRRLTTPTRKAASAYRCDDISIDTTQMYMTTSIIDRLNRRARDPTVNNRRCGATNATFPLRAHVGPGKAVSRHLTTHASEQQPA